MLAQYLSYEFIALFMFITMLLMMFTGQRVFGAIGFGRRLDFFSDRLGERLSFF